MCGITGYLGANAERELIDGLNHLEYRGYDSAGIAVLKDKINVTKREGKIAELEKIVKFDLCSNCGIAHTRWATHGAPTDENAHPHLSNNGQWAVVHNGIIENYETLKQDLKQHGFLFKSQTDTEVICNLLQFNNSQNPVETLIETAKMLKGSYAIACLNKLYKNTIFLAKYKSPLFIAKNSSQVFVASDVICFLDKAEEYYSLEDYEFCKAEKNKLTFYDKTGRIIDKKPQRLKNFEISNSKGKYKHFMLKEIMEIPKVLRKIVKEYKKNNIFGMYNRDFISKFNKIVLIGCGTAYHACKVGEIYLTDFARVNANAYVASEYRYSNPLIDQKTLCILVSQSGETADTLAVCDMAKDFGATTVALTNVPYSTLASKSKYVLPVCAGTEIAVASTKAYSAQISILYMFAKHLQNELFNQNNDYMADIQNLSKDISTPTKEEITPIIKELTTVNKSIKNNDMPNIKHVFFIGRNLDYVTALEASLKLKEITYIFSVEHPAGELKHGFLALIDSTSILFAVATNRKLLDKTLNGAFEAQSRGAKVILLTQFDLPEDTKRKFFKCIKLKAQKEELMPISTITFFQKLAYSTSISKGLNPDQPRNLAKSVTVE